MKGGSVACIKKICGIYRERATSIRCRMRVDLESSEFHTKFGSTRNVNGNRMAFWCHWMSCDAVCHVMSCGVM